MQLLSLKYFNQAIEIRQILKMVMIPIAQVLSKHFICILFNPYKNFMSNGYYSLHFEEEEAEDQKD